MTARLDDINAAIGRRLAEQRVAAGFSQAALARTLGVSPQQVQKYEHGQNRLSVASLLRIALTLNCDPAALFPPSDAYPVEYAA